MYLRSAAPRTSPCHARHQGRCRRLLLHATDVPRQEAVVTGEEPLAALSTDLTLVAAGTEVLFDTHRAPPLALGKCIGIERRVNTAWVPHQGAEAAAEQIATGGAPFTIVAVLIDLLRGGHDR